jgi:hypothetical protein
VAQRVKHSKIKNTGILFELLSRQITVDVMNDSGKSKAVEMLKKFFNESTELGKENQLYQVLLKENYNSSHKAEKLVDAVISAREKLQNKKLRTEKYNLIKEINGKYKNLNSMQRNLLKEYVNNISNTNSLREFINNEVVKIKQILNKILPRVTDDITKIKLTEAIKQTTNLSKGKIVKDKQVVALMRYYELIKELHNVTG